VVAVSHPPPLRYISISKGGQITVWSSSLHTLKTFVVSDVVLLVSHSQKYSQKLPLFYLNQLAGDPTEEIANTRRFRGWTTDAVYMERVHRVAIATDSRDLHFVSVNQTSVFEDIHLFGSLLTILNFSN